jgi:hypothetical protein
MKDKKQNRVSLLTVCAECGDALVLSPSGHQLCANRLCKDGFDVRPDWRLMTSDWQVAKSGLAQLESGHSQRGKH